MTKSISPDVEVKDKKELYSEINYEKTIDELRKDAINKLKNFCQRAGQRGVKELNEIIDVTELNEFIRMAFDDEHPTINKIDKIRPVDFVLDDSTGKKIIKASRKKGLSFCCSLKHFVKVAEIKARNVENTVAKLYIYTINEDAPLPEGLEFHKDKPGHVALIATQDITWNAMLDKLEEVKKTLNLFDTIEMIL